MDAYAGLVFLLGLAIVAALAICSAKHSIRK